MPAIVRVGFLEETLDLHVHLILAAASPTAPLHRSVAPSMVFGGEGLLDAGQAALAVEEVIVAADYALDVGLLF